LAGKGLGILRDRLQGALLGVDTVEGVAFMQASVLPRNFFDIMFASVFSASFIPVFNAYLQTKDKKAAFDLASLFISVLFSLTVIFTLLCVLLAQPIYTLFLSGGAIPPGTRELGLILLRLMFPLIIVGGVSSVFAGILQSLGEFYIPAATVIVSNAII